MENKGLATCLSCCECGIPITYNATSMCEVCLRSMIDITQNLNKKINIEHCFGCGRYLSPPSNWISGTDMKELLHVCLKLICGLSKYDVKDAEFLWTEPHSKRLKVLLTLQQAIDVTATVRGIGGGAAVEQKTVIEYVMHSHICENCTREAAKDYWNASVQVRQKADHKKTLYYMEQILMKYNAHKECLNIRKVADGIDFFFNTKSNAIGFVQFLQKKLPINYKESKKLKSHDDHNGTYNYKYTYCVEIPPVCKDDIVCLPKKFAQKLGNFNQICIIARITNEIHLLDPLSGQVRSVSANVYYANPFTAISSSRNMTQFLIVESELRPFATPKPGDLWPCEKHAMADVYALRMNDMTSQVHIRSHLGNVMQAGDVFLGVDMRFLNCNNDELMKIPEDKVPDVVLVKKYFDRAVRRRARRWQLHRLGHDDDGSVGTAGGEEGMQAFLEDIEEDEQMRAHVNIYADEAAGGPRQAEAEGLPEVPLEEMIGNLRLEYQPADHQMDIDQ